METDAPITMEELIDAGLKFNKDCYDFWVKDHKLEESQLQNVKASLALTKPIMRIGINEEQLFEIKTLNPHIHKALVDYFRRIGPFCFAGIIWHWFGWDDG